MITAEIIIELLNTYGLPTVLTILFIWFFKQSSDKYNNYLKEAVKEESKKSDKTEEIIKEIKEAKLAAEETSVRLTELQKTIMAYLLRERD